MNTWENIKPKPNQEIDFSKDEIKFEGTMTTGDKQAVIVNLGSEHEPYLKANATQISVFGEMKGNEIAAEKVISYFKESLEANIGHIKPLENGKTSLTLYNNNEKQVEKGKAKIIYATASKSFNNVLSDLKTGDKVNVVGFQYANPKGHHYMNVMGLKSALEAKKEESVDKASPEQQAEVKKETEKKSKLER